MRILLIAMSIASLGGCGAGLNVKASHEKTQAAIRAVQKAQFTEAYALASDALNAGGKNGTAAGIRALARYVKVMHAFREEIVAVFETRSRANGFNHPRMRKAMAQTQAALGGIDNDLKTAAQDSRFALELCLACWERDWNHNGRIDSRDRRLFQLEIDANGQRMDRDDPRRKPTFRFDVGDIHWARAMVAFQRATLEIILAYRFTELDNLLKSSFRDLPPKITIHMEDRSRVHHARALILAGLEHADRSRKAYLAETDDDREWVPNPKQKNHPLPLPVDQSLFDTWAATLSDLRQLVAGKTGISVLEVAQMGDHQWKNPPKGYIDIGRMLQDPKSVVFDIPAISSMMNVEGEPDIAKVLTNILGAYYVPKMTPTKMIKRFHRMKKELERNEDTFERKLRYLLWLN